MLSWFVAFMVTQVFEMPVYWVATKSLRVGFLASAMTHPIVWFVFPLLPIPYWPMVALAETFAVLAEAAWLHANGIPRGKSFLWSLAANTLSASMGLLIRATTGWV